VTKEKALEVVSRYRRKYEELNVSKKKHDYDSFLTPSETAEHCHAMLDDIEIFLGQGRTEKAFRWLGFVQGCLFKDGIYTIKELKDHNRSKE